MTDETQTNDPDAIDDEAVDELGTRDERRAALDDVRAQADALTDADIVAARSADSEVTEAAVKRPDDDHVKVFVVPPDGKPGSDYDHAPNVEATRSAMIAQGLRPTGDVKYRGAEPFGPGLKSWALTYLVPAVPAERFDFQPVHVIEEGDDENATGNAGGGTSESEAADEVPTKKAKREVIDAYGAKIGVDTTAVETKAEALALIAAHKPAE